MRQGFISDFKTFRKASVNYLYRIWQLFCKSLLMGFNVKFTELDNTLKTFTEVVINYYFLIVLPNIIIGITMIHKKNQFFRRNTFYCHQVFLSLQLEFFRYWVSRGKGQLGKLPPNQLRVAVRIKDFYQYIYLFYSVMTNYQQYCGHCGPVM